MAVYSIYIIRHGQREAFNFCEKSPTGTAIDPPLTEAGVEQSKELATYLKAQGIKVDAICSSPYYRCLQTATPTAEALNVKIFVERGISEYVRADPTGRTEHPSPPPGCDVLRDFFPMIAQDHHSSVKPAAHGETYEDLHNRAKLFIDNVQTHMAKYQPAGYSVILFTHAATAIALARSLSNDPDFALRTGTASITQFNAHSGKGDSDGTLKWECVQNGAVGHLSGGEKNHWDFSSPVTMALPTISTDVAC